MKVLLSLEQRKLYPNCPTEMPMDLFNEEWAQRVHSQSLNRLNDRGGLHPTEMIMNIEKISPRDYDTLDTKECIYKLNKLLRAHEIKNRKDN